MTDGRTAADREERAAEILIDALERPPQERRGFVRRSCGGDADLEGEVESLLEAHDDGGLFDRLRSDFSHLRTAIMDEGEDGRSGGSPVALRSGDRLGRYRIVDLLGTGGMGEVYRAHDPSLDREVAIKVISRRLSEEGDLLERFEREARAASALSHPHIITVHDFGEQDGHPYLVMELVRGRSLAEFPDEAMEAGELLRLGRQLAEALSAAHDAGVVHRDLKPENVLIDSRGDARIVDFGLASVRRSTRTLVDDAAVTPANRDPRQVMGTVGFSAPEVLRGAGADHRADQFSLGAILWELAAGRPAFPRGDVASGLAATLEEDPPRLDSLRDDLPGLLVETVDRCLAKDPQERYGSTECLLRDLAGATGELSAPRRSHRGVLPTPPTPLFGREEERRRVRRLLLDEGARLVTLTGIGGSGKTRLAVEVAREIESDFPGGVVFVPLASIQDPELVAQAIVSAAGGVEAGTGVDLPQLLSSLSRTEGRVLLLLDNFEQVIDAAPVVGELIEGAPDVSVLVTSREVLRLRAEHDIAVAPLEVPAADANPDPEELYRLPSVALFIDRARAAGSDGILDADNAPAVAELCRRLEGLPLALELAAARTRTFPPRAMLRRLRSRLDLLTAGPRDLPRRQRTLRAVLDSSFELLDEDEEAAFRRLAVFSGGFTLEAAAAVVDPFERGSQPVEERIAALQDQSLLRRDAETRDEPRFAMLETIAEYASGHLRRSEELAPTRQAHAAYFLVLAEDIERERGNGRGHWIGRLQGEEANLRSAFDWLVESDQAEWGLRLALALFHFWELGESLSEGRRRFEQLLALPSAQELEPLRAKALLAAGVLAASQQDHQAGIALHRDGLALFRELGDRSGQAVLLNALGIQLTDIGRYADARACYEESMELWRELGESDGAARSLSNFAYVLRQQGELHRSRELYREAVAMFERLGDRVSAAWGLNHEADVAHSEGDPEAAALYRRALDRFRALEEPWGIASTLVDLADLDRQRGRFDVAETRVREALAIFHRVGHQRGVARVLETLARLASEQGAGERVLHLVAAARNLRDRLGCPPADPELEQSVDEAVEAATRRLGRPAAEEAHRQGRERPLAELVHAEVDRSQQ